MKIYIDFDGVILDTDTTINNIIKDNNIDKKEYISNCNWDNLLNSTAVINNSINYLKESKLDINLLSKISTLEEGIAKVQYVYTKLTYLNKLYKAEDSAIKNKLRLYKNYKKGVYKDKICTVIFKNGNKRNEINVKAGKRVDIINNPKGDTLFSGWTINGNLFDLSKPIIYDIILDTSFKEE